MSQILSGDMGFIVYDRDNKVVWSGKGSLVSRLIKCDTDIYILHIGNGDHNFIDRIVFDNHEIRDVLSVMRHWFNEERLELSIEFDEVLTTGSVEGP